MKLASLLAVAALALPISSVGCSQGEAASSDNASEDVNAQTSPASIVRAYYAASRSPDVAAALEGITDERIILEAPSVLILNPLGRTDEVHGKAAFKKAIAGGAFLLKNARVAPAGRDNDPESGIALSVMTPAGAPKQLVVSRIQLPLPNGDLLTQVEFFEIENGKIVHIQSYYDATRFIAALPEIAVAKLKEAFAK